MGRQKKAAAPAAAPFSHREDEGRKFRTQYKIVYEFFKEEPRTMLDVSLGTGIMRANVCRYVDNMRKAGLIQCVNVGKDKHTGHKAGYYTTDKALFRGANGGQTSLW